MLDISPYLASLDGPIAVLLVMALVFAESGLLVGFFLPGDSLLFSVGVLLAGGVIHVPFLAMAGAVVAAAFIGDQVGYAIGRAAGPRIFTRTTSRLFSPRHAERATAFFVRHGPRAVILARFVPVVRTFTPTVAGVGRMTYRRFVVYNAIGATAWGLGMLTAGHLLGGVAFVASHVEVFTLGIVLLSVLPGVMSVLLARRRGSALPARVDASTGKPIEASS